MSARLPRGPRVHGAVSPPVRTLSLVGLPIAFVDNHGDAPRACTQQLRCDRPNLALVRVQVTPVGGPALCRHGGNSTKLFCLNT